MAYAIADHDTPEQEAARVAKVTLAWLGAKLEKLGEVKFELIHERQFIVEMTMMVNRRREVPEQRDIDRVKTLEWKYRRQLPAHARPKLNPDDPIVREMEANRGK